MKLFESGGYKLNIETKEELQRKERIEVIKKKIINIEEYKGVVHFTQLPNVEKILREGLTAKKATDNDEKRSWGYAGKLGGLGPKNLCLTIIGKDSSFKEWSNIAWGHAGQAALLIDSSKIDQRYLTPADKRLIEKAKDIPTQGQSAPFEITLRPYGESKTVFIPPEAIIGIVISPRTNILERTKKNPREEAAGNAAYFRDELGHIRRTDQKYLTITPEQARTIAINRLSRILKNNINANLVPLYDNKGQVLWPQ